MIQSILIYINIRILRNMVNSLAMYKYDKLLESTKDD